VTESAVSVLLPLRWLASPHGTVQAARIVTLEWREHVVFIESYQISLIVRTAIFFVSPPLVFCLTFYEDDVLYFYQGSLAYSLSTTINTTTTTNIQTISWYFSVYTLLYS
jgi:hypothetical protein